MVKKPAASKGAPKAARNGKDQPLAEDIRHLGRILGDTLREQESAAAFELVERIRPWLEPYEPVDERRMFGGLAFLVHEHMAVCVLGSGGIMVRVLEEERDGLVVLDGAGPMEMTPGRPSRTWVRVQGSALDDDATLGQWIERGADVAVDLPPKS